VLLTISCIARVVFARRYRCGERSCTAACRDYYSILGEIMEADGEGVDLQYAVEVVEQHNRFGVFGRDGRFKALSNFKIDFRYEVAAGSHSGFVCSTTLYNGDKLG